MKRVLVHVLRLGVCAAALWWALHGLSWHDWVTLIDGRRLQVVGESEGRIEALDAQGGRVAVDRRDIAVDADGEHRIEYGVLAVWRKADKRLLLLSLLLFLPVPALAALRFVWMLRAQDIHIRNWEGIKLTYAGNFFNFVMFGTTGGDLFKAYYAAQHTPHKVEAVMAVLLDRVIGLIAIVALATAASTFRLDDSRIRQLLLWLLLMLGVMAVGLLLFYMPGLRDRLRPAQRLRWVPGIDKLLRIDRAVLRMRERPAIVAGTFGLSALLQIIAIATFYIWALAVGMQPGWPSYFAYIGAALVVAAIPVTPMGLGTMEAALILFLSKASGGDPFGTKGQVVFLALGIRLIQLAWALPGVLVPLMGAHRPSAYRVRELEAAMKAEETGKGSVEASLS